jgi:hypothetical protein
VEVGLAVMEASVQGFPRDVLDDEGIGRERKGDSPSFGLERSFDRNRVVSCNAQAVVPPNCGVVYQCLPFLGHLRDSP